MITPEELETIEQTALKASAKAAEVLLKHIRTKQIYEKGSSNNLVTAADLEAQEVIQDVITSTFPDHSFYNEEGEDKDSLDSENLWLIDPLDGTTNYAHGIPIYCTSIAYARKGKVLFGSVFDPNLNEHFTARAGKGAFINGERISVSQRSSLKESVIATGFYYDRDTIMRRTLGSIEALFNNGLRGIRRMGSAAIDICWVAAGRFEGFFEYKLSPWDFAAGMLIAREAGGLCTDIGGEELSLKSRNIAVSNIFIHTEMLKILETTRNIK